MRTRQSFVWRFLTIVFYALAFFIRSSNQSKSESNYIVPIAPNLLDIKIPHNWYLARQHGAMVGLPSTPPNYVKIDTKEFTDELFKIEPQIKIPPSIKLGHLLHRNPDPKFFYERVKVLSQFISYLHDALGGDVRKYYPLFSRYCYFLATNFGVRHKELLNDIVKLYKLSYLFYPANAVGWRNKLDYLWDPAWAAFDNQNKLTSYIFFCLGQHTLTYQELTEILQHQLPWYLTNLARTKHRDFVIDAVIKSDRLQGRFSLEQIGSEIDKDFLKKYSFLSFYIHLLEHSTSPASNLDLIIFLQHELTVLHNLDALPEYIIYAGQHYSYEQFNSKLVTMHNAAQQLVTQLEYEDSIRIFYYFSLATLLMTAGIFHQFLLFKMHELLANYFPERWNPDYIKVLNNLRNHPLLKNNSKSITITPHLKNITVTLTLPTHIDITGSHVGNKIALTTEVIRNTAGEFTKDFPSKIKLDITVSQDLMGFKLVIIIPNETMIGLDFSSITRASLLKNLIKYCDETKAYNEKLQAKSAKSALIKNAEETLDTLEKDLQSLPEKHKNAEKKFKHFFDYAEGVLDKYVDEEIRAKATEITNSYNRFSNTESNQEARTVLSQEFTLIRELLKADQLTVALDKIKALRTKVDLFLAFDAYEHNLTEKKMKLDHRLRRLHENPQSENNELRRRSSSGKTSQEILNEIINLIERSNFSGGNVYTGVIYTLKNYISLLIEQLPLLTNKQSFLTRFKHNFIFLCKRLEYLILIEDKNDVETKLKSLAQHLKEKFDLNEVTEANCIAQLPLLTLLKPISEREDDSFKLHNSQQLLINSLNYLCTKRHQIRERIIEREIALPSIRGCFAVLGQHWEQMQAIKQNDIGWWDRSEHRNSEYRRNNTNPLKKKSMRDLLVECKNPTDENTLFEELCDQAPSFIASLQKVGIELDNGSASAGSSMTASNSTSMLSK